MPAPGPRRPTSPVAVAGLVAVAFLVVLGGLLAWVADAVTAADPAPPARSADAATPTPTTSAGHRFWATEDGRPVRWDPCRPIRWVLNETDAPPGARRDLRRAMDRITEVTGIRFEHVGTTTESPGRERPLYRPDVHGDRWAPVLVAWTRPHPGGLPLRDTDRAVSIPVAVTVDGPDVFVTGQIVFNRDRRLQPGFTGRPASRGATMLHELAHLVGLDHVEDPTQLMHRFPGQGPARLADGDRRGLRALGRRAGCRSVPDPGPADVTYTQSRP